MGKMRLDKNYNIKSAETSVYHDQFDDMVELIVQKRADNELTEEETSVLLKLALRKELKNDFRSFFHTFFNTEQKPEKYTMFMQLKTRQIKHAS